MTVLTPKPPKPPTLYAIPAGSKPRRCSACPAMIYMVTWMPLRAAPTCTSHATGRVFETPDATPPTDTEPGKGFSHFIDCENPDAFRRRHNT